MASNQALSDQSPDVQHAASTAGFSHPAPGPSRSAYLAGQETHDHDGHDSDTPGLSSSRKTSAQSFTPRSLLVGLGIGTLITFSNTYFGLQTGWISSMAMPSSLIGFAVFKAIAPYLSFPFSPIENVLIQTVAGAVGTMPLGCGFVGVIPALEFLLRDGPDGERGGDDGQGEGGPLRLGFWKLVVWSLGVCLFGVVFAVPLRKEVIVREKLKFPSGTATALMIRVLHGSGQAAEKPKTTRGSPNAEYQETERLLASEPNPSETSRPPSSRDLRQDWKGKIRLLILAFGVSAFYTLLSYFVPIFRNLPVFGFTLASKWLWTLNPSPAYVGQGIIMGSATSLHMLVGAIVGWGILSPLAKSRGWAPGPVDNWENGSKGWIVWVSLAIMLADSVMNLGWLILRPVVHYAPDVFRVLRRRTGQRGFWQRLFSKSSNSREGYIPIGHGHDTEEQDPAPDISKKDYDEKDAPPSELVSMRTVAILLPLTLILNVVCMHIAFGSIITPFLSSLATLLALVLSVMGVRALGETDLNPVSGISKVTQLIFALATPSSSHTRRSAIVTNLLAGAVSESGALQAGDMMQDLKTGHILHASPKAQFYGQLIGSLFGAVISVAVYRLYINVYEVPGDMFQIPTAYVWIFTARLVTGQGLPDMAWQVSGIAAVIFTVTTIVRIFGAAGLRKGGSAPSWRAWIPGGIAVAVGMYNVPSFTLARAIGGLIDLWWRWRQKKRQKGQRAIAASALHGEDDGGGDGSLSRSQDEQGDNQGANGTHSTIVILASGLILGEGVVSIVNLALASAGVPHL
ncbi:small oligopeptide transporter, OPT family protein [Coccidioides posadasii C735 delta SOWgp]|uniref:Small oligopeptide transporter, OPT family protein n=1 Tax=Coccidioides posadasii (strain C735) TaxID=222929 RepID=C5PA80_COCP7|nr:small oligopeptide transporter, OPT family protein [Coccidioides posadasii C735 delta SOWgp]EER26642.1 small oligopeptide transporter, OPT family protein [Coccidioides posadasii C735 delta SOWgp]|eukprot:XP_003068787.1 small oligopeptide transporter, OPT family protein [Coccidioides posadasii C735 delta SOWgp]